MKKFQGRNARNSAHTFLQCYEGGHTQKFLRQFLSFFCNDKDGAIKISGSALNAQARRKNHPKIKGKSCSNQFKLQKLNLKKK
ncbi:hypothetical protein [Pedobacter aquatilis]|uniref:hypothetical protein n=1 Tax=Pedobacter aquatilis TaxID=351343 RepID=UPI0025B3383D|nr:hypothetical protein [Pedobacter aquatilis]